MLFIAVLDIYKNPTFLLSMIRRSLFTVSTSHIRNVKANSDLLLFRSDSDILLWNYFKDDMQAIITFAGLQ